MQPGFTICRTNPIIGNSRQKENVQIDMQLSQGCTCHEYCQRSFAVWQTDSIGLLCPSLSLKGVGVRSCGCQEGKRKELGCEYHEHRIWMWWNTRWVPGWQPQYRHYLCEWMHWEWGGSELKKLAFFMTPRIATLVLLLAGLTRKPNKPLAKAVTQDRRGKRFQMCFGNRFRINASS